MRILNRLIIIFLTISTACAKEPKIAPNSILNPDFNKKVKSLVSGMDSKIISVPELKILLSKKEKLTILDARETKEFNVSHILNAKSIGYKNFNLKETIKHLDPKSKIIVYCSVGYRSGKVAEKLKQKGFEVYNLYGGIFEWLNQGHEIVGKNEKKTNKIHSYDEDWGKWLTKGLKEF